MHKLIPIYIVLVIALLILLGGCATFTPCDDCAVLNDTAPSVTTEYVTVNGETYRVERLKVR